MRTFTARYSGTCESCCGPIEAGDEAGYTLADDLVHADCGTGAYAAESGFDALSSSAEDFLEVTGPPGLAPCPACFLVPSTSGACGCEAS